MTDRELMKQVMENICSAKLCEINSMSSRQEMLRLLDKAIDSLRDRLAQPEQKEDWQYVQQLNAFSYPRPWVGLTDEEIKHMLELFVIPPQHIEMVVQAIEAKLKEKNT
jgi:hypothetical protein